MITHSMPSIPALMFFSTNEAGTTSTTKLTVEGWHTQGKLQHAVALEIYRYVLAIGASVGV